KLIERYTKTVITNAYTAANAAASVALAIPNAILKTRKIGKINVNDADKKLRTISYNEALGSIGYFLLIEIKIVNARYVKAIKIPGIAPAKNISPTDNFESQAIIIITLLGGIIKPTTDAEAFNAAENEEG